MAISLYTGTPGSYKSYHAVCDAINHLKFGRNVIANFPMDFSPVKLKPKGIFEYWESKKITPSNLLKFAKEHHKKSYDAQTVVIIDEASTMFNPREFGKKDRMEWINFFANHRHFNFSFILITQSDKMLDSQIRGLIEYEIRHRAVANYNFLTYLFSKLIRGIYGTVEFWYPCKMRNGGNFHKFNKRKASCYDTMALFIDNPYGDKKEESEQEQKHTKSKVVIINEQIADNDTQRKQDDKTTLNLNGIDYDTNTGVSTVASDRTGGSNSRC